MGSVAYSISSPVHQVMHKITREEMAEIVIQDHTQGNYIRNNVAINGNKLDASGCNLFKSFIQTHGCIPITLVFERYRCIVCRMEYWSCLGILLRVDLQYYI